ncbi:hypothetical protein FA13DRAFT_1721510 [Coprinellus micaceus]|uniref:Uncharacterized protein n=1 Tax=Coprinellus micaceus TaxID=71717 RepID=A0A4Y7RZZ4_COPMI|nr:hypothetical protein FA13DRAFT_1721510 [Coprinellus micaceus]
MAVMLSLLRIRIYFAISAWNKPGRVPSEQLLGVMVRSWSTGATKGVSLRKSPISCFTKNVLPIPPTCGTSWPAGRAGLPSKRHPDETFTSLANLIDIFNREIAVGGLPVPDADWVIHPTCPKSSRGLNSCSVRAFGPAKQWL